MELSYGWMFNTEFGGWFNKAIVIFGQKWICLALASMKKVKKKIINKWVVSEKEHG